MAEHGFKQEQGKDPKDNIKGPLNKRDVDSKTPNNAKNDRRSSGKKKGGDTVDPAMLQAIMMMLAQMEGSAPSGPGGMPPMGPGGGMPPGGPGGLSLPPGAVEMGPPPMGNPAMQGRMGMMPPMPATMPPGGMPVR